MAGKEPNFSFDKHFLLSLGGHIGLFLAFTMKAYIFPSEPVEIRRSIRVDVVGLPDKVQPKKAAPAPKPKKVAVKKPAPKPKSKKPAPKPKKTVNLNKAKSKQQKALERLKALDALEKMKKEVADEQAKAAQANAAKENTDPPPTEFKGNIITSGSSLSGLDRLAFERYYDDMSNHVKSHWSLPTWLADAQLKAEAAVTIDERGFVTSKRIYSSSGNQVFDDLVMQTVEKASPFPAPPARLKSVLALKGMILGFPE